MLAAIGIYKFTHDETKPFIIVKAKQIAVKDNTIQTALKNGFSLFGESSLSILDKLSALFDKEISLPRLTFDDIQSASLNLVKILHFKDGNEHQYITRFNDNHLVVLFSNRLLDQTEAYYLALNSSRVFKDTQNEGAAKLGITLENILTNYLGYTGKDCLIETIQNDLEETKKIIQHDVDILIERGEHLQRIETNAFQLKQTAEEFEAAAKELNQCCGLF